MQWRREPYPFHARGCRVHKTVPHTVMEFSALPRQREAIEAAMGPVLVVAGPGAGKTFCLIGRVNHLVTVLGYPPERICAVTFTNKAAEEIAIRLRRTLGHRAEEVTRSTLHSLCMAILREYAEAAGLRRGFGLADEEYQRIVLRRLKLHPKRTTQLLALFGRRRFQGFELTTRDEQMFREYTAHLSHRNLLDFDDLIARTRDLFQRRKDVADAVASRWDYLLVDEFQDLTPVHYEILARLAAPHRNVFAVGDDEQSIYSWNGADPRVLLRFRDDFGIAEPIVLDRNCRCSRPIFETARRLLLENPQLFDKQLRADRESPDEVRAFNFEDDNEEAAWLISDLSTDRESTRCGWGDYALLYRKHEVGNQLEARLLNAGIPCRLARGHSVGDDEVIGHVIAGLRLMRDPTDAVAAERYAALVLSKSEHLLQELRVISPAGFSDFVAAVRAMARRRSSSEADTRKLWRFVYQVENLVALYRSHRSLPALVDDLLSQGVGPYRNALEECHEELSDPADVPVAVRLAERLEEACGSDASVHIQPQSGLEIGLRGMLLAAGFRRVASYDLAAQAAPGSLILGPSDGGDLGLATALFKALQLMHARRIEESFRSYVTFDFETTDDNTEACELVEIGAAKVVAGEIVGRFHSLVRPGRPITPRASRIHGRTEEDVRDARAFPEVWPEFCEFARGYVLIAHNGQKFDVPVLRRLAEGLAGLDELVFFDTLPLARSLSPGSARLGDLAARFGIEPGRAHCAIDDAVTLAHVFRRLSRERVIRARKTVLVNLLDYLGLSLALEQVPSEGEERKLLREITSRYALGRYTECLDFYAAERERIERTGPSVDEVIERLGGRARMERLRADRSPGERFPAAVARLKTLMEGASAASLDESIDRLLDRVALSTVEGADVDPHRVNLLTLHSTKGLEFSRVYVVGVEDYQIPGYYETVEERDLEIQEGRRLLYVGMTRARDRLVLTRAGQRFGRYSGESRFLDEMGLVAMPCAGGT